MFTIHLRDGGLELRLTKVSGFITASLPFPSLPLKPLYLFSVIEKTDRSRSSPDGAESSRFCCVRSCASRRDYRGRSRSWEEPERRDEEGDITLVPAFVFVIIIRVISMILSIFSVLVPLSPQSSPRCFFLCLVFYLYLFCSSLPPSLFSSAIFAGLPSLLAVLLVCRPVP